MGADATAVRDRLIAAARAAGFAVSAADAELTGVKQAVVARWLFGRRVAEHRFQLTLDAASRSMSLREAVYERSVGIRPPSWSFGVWRQRGTDYREDRIERGPWGGGTVDFGTLRDALRQVAEQTGWDFRYVPTEMPAPA